MEEMGLSGDELLDTVEHFLDKTKGTIVIAHVNGGEYEGQIEAVGAWKVEGDTVTAGAREENIYSALEMMLAKINELPQ